MALETFLNKVRPCARSSAALAAVLALAALLGAGCSKSKPAPEMGFMHGPVPVTVAQVVSKTVPIQLQAIGTVQAYSTVSLKSQIDGRIATVYFREGQTVKKGDLLVQIDPRPFEAALHQAEADLARDRAQLFQADTDEKRYTYLLQQGVGSQQQYDQAHANAAALRATVLADEAAVQTAKINLGYTEIRSPIDGRTGALLLHPGNLVKANDAGSVIVIINQIKPIYVDFSMPERELARVRRFMNGRQLAVAARPKGDSAGRPELGTLSFIDNAVNISTGTFAAKGIFANEDQRLWPGQFADVTLTLSEEPDTIVVPSQAVQTGQDGSFVFVVGRDLSASPRPVVVGDSLDGETVVKSGLKAGETVVTDGQLRLFPGARVRIKNAPAQPAQQVAS
ncbi:MAG TPA: efflux RND transporter periplasmic adaptor subunit [Candidatus Binataceae bacterium]|nr:efflux RND transporter periplasmic adaptor subunit [Candidatus Binataceae bacterium]